MLFTPDASFLGVYCGDVFQSKMGNVPASENRRYKHVRLNVLMTRNLLARQRIACTGECEVDFHRRYGFSGVFASLQRRQNRCAYFYRRVAGFNEACSNLDRAFFACDVDDVAPAYPFGGFREWSIGYRKTAGRLNHFRAEDCQLVRLDQLTGG